MGVEANPYRNPYRNPFAGTAGADISGYFGWRDHGGRAFDDYGDMLVPVADAKVSSWILPRL